MLPRAGYLQFLNVYVHILCSKNGPTSGHTALKLLAFLENGLGDFSSGFHVQGFWDAWTFSEPVLFISIFPWLLKETKRWERPRKTFCGFSRHNGRFLWACLKYLANHVANRSCDNWLIGSKCLLGRGCKVRLAIFPLVDVFNSYRTVKGCWRQFFWSRWSFTSGKNCRWPWLFFKEGLNNRS